ncbi:MAG: hypothetical protein JSR39_02665 [Verrucomicrobia bacterium]|nr:hypothetical protein [Verrucomicrobiota bacterium]
MSVRLDQDAATYIVSLAAPEEERTRKLSPLPGKGFISELKGYFGEVPIQLYLDKHFKGVDPRTLEGGKKKVYEALFQNADISVNNQIKIVKAVIKRFPIGKEYIQNIPYAQTEHLVPVCGMKFYKALELTYGLKAVQEANKQIFGMDNSLYHGVKEFKDRVSTAMSDDSELYPEDQKYIQDLVQNCAYIK